MDSLLNTNMLATGKWAILMDMVALYGGICIYHNRAPLWPKRTIKCRAWTLALIWVWYLGHMAFYIINNLNMFNTSAPRQLRRSMFSIVSTLIYLLRCAASQHLIPRGIFSYAIGIGAPLNITKSRENDEPAKPDSDRWSGETRVAAVDVEAVKDSGADIRLQVEKWVVWRRALGRYAFFLPLWDAGLLFVLCSIHKGVVEDGDTKMLCLVGILAPFLLFIALVRLLIEKLAAEDGDEESVSNWVWLWRFLPFYVFYQTVFMLPIANLVLAEALPSKWGGVPDLAGLGDTSQARGYGIFAGSVVCYVLPLFAW